MIEKVTIDWKNNILSVITTVRGELYTLKKKLTYRALNNSNELKIRLNIKKTAMGRMNGSSELQEPSTSSPNIYL